MDLAATEKVCVQDEPTPSRALLILGWSWIAMSAMP